MPPQKEPGEKKNFSIVKVSSRMGSLRARALRDLFSARARNVMSCGCRWPQSPEFERPACPRDPRASGTRCDTGGSSRVEVYHVFSPSERPKSGVSRPISKSHTCAPAGRERACESGNGRARGLVERRPKLGVRASPALSGLLV